MSYQNAICQLLIGDQLFGTGFLFTDDQRHILTAHHVVEGLARALDLGAPTIGTKLSGAAASFRTALLQRELGRVACFDAHTDWAVLELGHSLEVPPLPFAAPTNGAPFRAWGYPNALHVGLAIPGHATLHGELDDVLDPGDSHALTLVARNASDSCRGMSGAPVIVDSAWVGLVTSAHVRDGSAPLFNQLSATRAEQIVPACEEYDLPVRGGRYRVKPLPPDWAWPDDPFPGLIPLGEEHARMLHGRFRVLRRLLDYIQAPSDRLLVVSGRVGVGKSSLLRAGLVPYLRARGGHVILAVHDSNTNLADVLRILAHTATNKSVLVLDQVEECVIGKRGEGEEFARELARVLDRDRHNAPACIVLGCRSDYADELEQHLRDAHLRWRWHSLKPLKKEDIIEVLTVGGALNSEATNHFRIEVQFTKDRLEDFANDLLRDEDTNVAPLLQLRMREMYRHAVRQSSASGHVQFGDRIYDEVAGDLASIEQHLNAQLDGWPKELEPHVESGLVLDILHFHTSLQATASPKVWAMLEDRYTKPLPESPFGAPCTPSQLVALINQMQTMRLLVDREWAGQRRTSIGHDELARVASQTFQRSPRPGQRCRRMLEYRLENLTVEDASKVVLDDLDLQIAETGHMGMRTLTAQEAACIAYSLEHRQIRIDRERAQEAADAEKKRQLDEAKIQKAEAEAERARAEALAVKVKADAEATQAAIVARNQKLVNRVAALVVAIVIVAMVIGVVLYRKERKTATADSLRERGAVELAKRNFGEAEILYAKALAIRDEEKTRFSLLQARRGAIQTDRRIASSGGQFTGTSADGQYFATAMAARADHLDVGVLESNKILWTIDLAREGKRTVEAMAFSSADGAVGRLLAVAFGTEQTHQVFLFRLQLGGTGVEAATPLGTIAGPSKRISSLAFDPATTLLAVGGDDGSLSVYNITSKPALLWHEPNAHTIAVHGVMFRHDGKLLASGGGDYGIHFWWVTETNPAKRRIASLWGHQDSVFAVAFSADGKRLASGGYDRGIRIWDVGSCLEDKCVLPCPDEWCERTGIQTIRVLQGHEGVVNTLQFSKNGAMLASGSKDETVRLWDVERSRVVATLQPHVGPLRSISFSDFGQPVACGGEKGWARWKTGGRQDSNRLWINGAPIYSLSIDPTSTTLLVGTSNGTIWTWKIGSQERPVLFAEVDLGVNGVSFSADGRWIAAVGEGRTLHLWKRDGTAWTKLADVPETTFDGPVWGIAFDESAKYLAAGAAGKAGKPPEIRLWKLSETQTWVHHQTVPTVHDNYALTFAGTSVVSGNSHGELNVYSVQGLTPEPSNPHTNVTSGERNVWGLTATDFGAVVSANSDGIVRVWKPGDATELASDDPSTNPTLNSVSYSAKRRAIAASGDGNQVVEYDLPAASAPGGTLRIRQRFYGQEGTVWFVTYSPDGRWLAYGGLDGFIRVIDLDATDRLSKAQPAELLRLAEESTKLYIANDQTVHSRED